MSIFYLSKDASKARIRDAENARKNRAEIIAAYSQGKVSRCELIKWGLFTSAGALAPIGGLNAFVPSAGAQATKLSGTVTGLPPSPLFGVQPFTTPMPRFDLLPRTAVSSLTPTPTAESNQTLQAVDPALGAALAPSKDVRRDQSGHTSSLHNCRHK